MDGQRNVPQDMLRSELSRDVPEFQDGRRFRIHDARRLAAHQWIRPDQVVQVVGEDTEEEVEDQDCDE